MTKDGRDVDVRAIDLLLGEVVNTREKLEVVACLQHAGSALTTVAIAAHVGLPWVVVAEALGELHRAGLVSTSNEDGAGWWLEELSAWREVIAVLVHFYERDRTLLLRRMVRVALHRLRAVRRTDVSNVIRLHFKYEP